MDIRAVLFDLDGTLVDSLPGIEFSVDCALKECQAGERGRDLRPLIGPPIRTILGQLVSGVDDDQLTRLEQAFRGSYNASGWRKTILHAGAADTLRKLQTAGVAAFLVTNKPQAPTGQILEALGLAGWFADVVCRDSKNPQFRSKAEMLDHVIAGRGLDRASCLYVGDSLEDYQAATEVGVAIALVAHGYGEVQTGLPGCTRHTGTRTTGTKRPVRLNSLGEVLNLAGVLEAV